MAVGRLLMSSRLSSTNDLSNYRTKMLLRLRPSLRPCSCVRAVVQHSKLPKAPRKCYATVAPSSTTTPVAYTPRQRDKSRKVSKFQVWPRLQSLRFTVGDPMIALKKHQIAKLDPNGARTRLFNREEADTAKPGDVLMVTTKQGEPFSGALIEIRRRGVDTAILLRGQLMRVGVEKWFKIYSPTVLGIDVIWRRPKRARRARLTYMRKPKHDMGNVDHLVAVWKRERYALGGKGGQSSGRKARK